MKFTIFGGTGFIGQYLNAHLLKQGHDVSLPAHNHNNLSNQNLGHVIYAIGLTGDFRHRPLDAVDAHVCKLSKYLKGTQFFSFLYLSSTRVYQGLDGPDRAVETSSLSVRPDPDNLYNLSKLLGEAMCFSLRQDNIRVARLSNVYGTGQSKETFLGSIIADLQNSGGTTVQESANSSKDYVSVHDAVMLIEKIALQGQHTLYNLARGQNITHGQLAKILRMSGYEVSFLPDAPTRCFPKIDTGRIDEEFSPSRVNILDTLATILTE
jgi:nucleoside-diphosphate-sugar epimerase